MKRILTFVALFVAVSALVFGVTPLVSAQSTSTRCTVSKAKLMTRIDKVQAANDAQVTVYTKITERVNKIVTAAGETDFDTTDLKAAVTATTSKEAAYSQKALALVTALQAVSDAACGNSDVTYTTALNAARTAMTEARAASADVKKSFKEVVVPALKEYATYLKDNASQEDK